MNRLTKETLNLNKTRNVENSWNIDYNCFGYAFNIFEWLCFDYLSDIDMYVDYSIPLYTENDIDLIEHAMAKEIVNMCKGLCRQVYSPKELRKNEFLVLFRLATNYNEDVEEYAINDFHFIKRLHNGEYVHKMGAMAVETYYGDPLDSCEYWNDKYNGSIILFAVNNKMY